MGLLAIIKNFLVTSLAISLRRGITENVFNAAHKHPLVLSPNYWEAQSIVAPNAKLQPLNSSIFVLCVAFFVLYWTANVHHPNACKQNTAIYLSRCYLLLTETMNIAIIVLFMPKLQSQRFALPCYALWRTPHFCSKQNELYAMESNQIFFW